MADIYLLIDGQQQGPYSELDVHQYLTEGRIQGDQLAWKEGLSEWVQVITLLSTHTIQSLAVIASEATPEIQPVASKPPPLPSNVLYAQNQRVLCRFKVGLINVAQGIGKILLGIGFIIGGVLDCIAILTKGIRDKLQIEKPPVLKYIEIGVVTLFGLLILVLLINAGINVGKTHSDTEEQASSDSNSSSSSSDSYGSADMEPTNRGTDAGRAYCGMKSDLTRSEIEEEAAREADEFDYTSSEKAAYRDAFEKAYLQKAADQ